MRPDSPPPTRQFLTGTFSQPFKVVRFGLLRQCARRLRERPLPQEARRVGTWPSNLLSAGAHNLHDRHQPRLWRLCTFSSPACVCRNVFLSPARLSLATRPSVRSFVAGFAAERFVFIHSLHPSLSRFFFFLTNSPTANNPFHVQAGTFHGTDTFFGTRVDSLRGGCKHDVAPAGALHARVYTGP